MAKPECIRLRGVRQNNLKGFDVDIPLGRYVVVTGLSGAGKSSLVFDTLHAEGQRRYVETFSAYTRQFLDLLDKPRVDSIENIRPSIAIGQTNTVKTSRSTVGTMTELTDYAKVWFSHAAGCFDPATGRPIDDDDPQSIWAKAFEAHAGAQVAIAFPVSRPGSLTWAEILASLQKQGYTRMLHEGPEKTFALRQLEDLGPIGPTGPILILQDRVAILPEHRLRFAEAVEASLHLGQGDVRLLSEVAGTQGVYSELARYSGGRRSPATGRVFREATPGLFSFNSPLGACPRCRGFGRIIEIDYRLAIPDPSLSIDAGAIRCWEGKVYSSSKDDLRVFARKRRIPTDVPFSSLTGEQRAYVVDGEPGYNEEEGKTWPKCWYGVKGFFRWLEKNTYKMHVRVFLSRYRAYNRCPECGGARLQPEALCWKWRGATLPELYARPVSDLLAELGLDGSGPGGEGPGARAAGLARDSMMTRLRYLDRVGVGYLTPDRASRTLSGGEVQRVNLTGCLGTGLVDTLFVLDEPSVGLHPRDIDRLIAILRSLTDAGNTVVVVEHDEAMIRAADHAIEIGPEPGARGGRLVFQGTVGAMIRSTGSITGAYLSGRKRIPVPAARRPVAAAADGWLEFSGVTKHNVRQLDFRIPLRRFVCLSGVSGSGKSTLLDHAIHQGLLAQRGEPAPDPAGIASIRGAGVLTGVVLVDQSPLARTPRSNAAIYSGAWELIRELYASTPAARAEGFGPSSFSFNSGDGRCDHCHGLGSERVEMQFLSDVFVPCPVCEGRRFKPEVLAIEWNGHSVADLLSMGVTEALAAFKDRPDIRMRLGALESAGLGYLALGQPLNTLSGGESQRLKLVRYLSDFGGAEGGAPAGALLLLDEPTTGLHRHDVRRLVELLNALVDRGHSLVVIEHNLDVLKAADWILEVGPEAGLAGGRIVAEGTPEEIAAGGWATSPYLRAALAEAQGEPRGAAPADAKAAALPAAFRSRFLEIHGARENNLKDLSLRIPNGAYNVITGVSGSGKSTLAFDIIFAEGQRRFMESMSPYARQFVEQLPRPAMDLMTGIPPTVAIEQRVTRGSRKSTVATITEVAQYLRLLYARVGVQHHPDTGRAVAPLSTSALRKLLARAVSSPAARRSRHLYLCAPLVRGRKGHHQPIATWMARQGYVLMRADGVLLRIDSFRKLDRYKEHDIEVVVADLKLGNASAALDTALRLGHGSCFLLAPGGKASWFSTTRTDAETGESFPELDPKHFSFNSPRGWCPACRGYGRIFERSGGEEDDDLPPEVADLIADQKLAGRGHGDAAGKLCPVCGGARLNRVSRSVKLHTRGRAVPFSLPNLLAGTPAEIRGRLRSLALDARGRLIARDIVGQIEERLRFLERVGLDYLTLDRPTETLSGGEAQRIRLAAQLGSNLAGVLYVLDEPSIGLHARDSERLVATLQSLRAKGNTLLVVEHDEAVMAQADHIIDLGPGAGVHGGELLAEGSPAAIRRSARSLTGLFLARGIRHPLCGPRRPVGAAPGWMELRGARHRNLKGFDLRLPLGRLIMVAGPSGAGKSTLCADLLRPAATFAAKSGRARLSGAAFARTMGFDRGEPPPFDELTGAAPFGAVIAVDQDPIGKTPRSTPATYLGIFDLIRALFASLPGAKMRGYTASRFSFNTAGGRCPTCEGAGRIRLEMAFMPDAYLPCDDCGGLRYGPDLANIAWNGKTIGEVLRLTFDEAAVFFDFHSHLSRVCRLMADCGLGYLTLGQSSPTLSGGEAQRLKLVTELSRGLSGARERLRGRPSSNLYILEEPTIGLHLSDCEKLIRVLQTLVDQGHTVVVVEHHPDLLAEADYIVELGPTGGPAGGRLLYQGPLAGLLTSKRSPTAPFIRKALNRNLL